MIRALHYTLTAAILAVWAAHASAASVDPYHGECTPEAALDAPGTWSSGKGIRIAPTCTPFVGRWEPAVFERAKGAPLNADERGVLFYRWHRLHEPDRVMFTPPDVVYPNLDNPAPPPVPVPPMLPMFALALAALIWRGWKR